MTHAIVHVAFKNSLGQVAQAEDVPLHVLTSGPYPDTVDLSASPLAPGQSKPFRLTFEHVSTDWNQAYPDLQVTSHCQVTARRGRSHVQPFPNPAKKILAVRPRPS